MAPPPADRLSSLPDEILAQILSFLPAQEAVRTCVLARAWRDAWEFTRRLRIAGGRAPWRTSGSSWTAFFASDSTSSSVPITYLAAFDEARARRRTIRLSLPQPGWLSSPALEHLEIDGCFLSSVEKIMSPSLKRLVITECYSNEWRTRFKISVPCLVSLWMEVGGFRAPLLESMPELVEAYVRIDSYCWGDNCYCDDPMGCFHVMQAGHISDGHVDRNCELNTEDYPGPNTNGCVLLEGLAQAKDLVLLAHHSKYIFRRDLRMRPTFSNLKTLVLNGYWCQPADCRALACILEHAPVLENLTVVFSEEVENF